MSILHRRARLRALRETENQQPEGYENEQVPQQGPDSNGTIQEGQQSGESGGAEGRQEGGQEVPVS